MHNISKYVFVPYKANNARMRPSLSQLSNVAIGTISKAPTDVLVPLQPTTTSSEVRPDVEYDKWTVVVLYFCVTLLDLIRAVIHTFFYRAGLETISGLATKQPVCDNRLATLIVAYGGANFESFIVRFYVLYMYARHDNGRSLVRVTSIAAAVWTPLTMLVTLVGNIDPGDADLPGRYAMLARCVVSLIIVGLTYV